MKYFLMLCTSSRWWRHLSSRQAFLFSLSFIFLLVIEPFYSNWQHHIGNILLTVAQHTLPQSCMIGLQKTLLSVVGRVISLCRLKRVITVVETKSPTNFIECTVKLHKCGNFYRRRATLFPCYLASPVLPSCLLSRQVAHCL